MRRRHTPSPAPTPVHRQIRFHNQALMQILVCAPRYQLSHLGCGCRRVVVTVRRARIRLVAMATVATSGHSVSGSGSAVALETAVRANGDAFEGLAEFRVEGRIEDKVDGRV